MSNVNVAAAEKLGLVGVMGPRTVANAEQFTNPVDMARFHQCVGFALLGDMAAETINFTAYSCDSDGSNSAPLKAAAQLVGSASGNDNSQVLINVRAEDLQTTGKRFVRFGLVTGGATGGQAAILALGVDSRFQPASDFDLASVKQIRF